MQPAIWPEAGPAFFASSIRRDTHEGCAVALIGLPDDLGVRLNRGRPGAAQGPGAFRAALARFGMWWDATGGGGRDLRSVTVWDAGDVTPAPGDTEAALGETHRRITEALAAIHALNVITVCIGGGHDLTFPAVRALAGHGGVQVGGVSIDPHLDVRETAGSGMAFRALIDGGHIDPARFTVFGAGRFANSREHLEWLCARGGTVITLEEVSAERLRPALDRAAAFDSPRPAFVSFDLDSVDSSAAPGVSALNPCGLTSREAGGLAFIAGADPRVRHFDLMELSPPHDEQGRTARLAAFLFLSFIAGVSERSA